MKVSVLCAMIGLGLAGCQTVDVAGSVRANCDNLMLAVAVARIANDTSRLAKLDAALDGYCRPVK